MSPPELTQRALGEHVRGLRVRAAISLRALAGLTGFSPSFISQFERGEVSPSIASMQKIAAALGVTLSQFFAAVAKSESVRIVRSDAREALSSVWSNAEIQALSLPGPKNHLEATLVTLRPGGRSGKRPHESDREEFAFVLAGKATLTLGQEDHMLRRGDAASISPGEARLWRNAGRAAAQVLVVTARAAGPLTLPLRRPLTRRRSR